MRKIVSLLLTLSLVLSSIVIGTAAPAIPSDVVSLINQYNYSSEKYDTSDHVVTWVKKSPLKPEDKTALTNLSMGTQKDADGLDFTGYLTKRELVKSWELYGKADPKLGQAYQSQVSMVFGQIMWEHLIIKTKIWVKKTSGQNAVTKVEYSIVPGKYSLSLKNFMTDNNSEIRKNFYANEDAYFSSFFDKGEGTLTLAGVTLTPYSNATTFYNGNLIDWGLLADVDTEHYYYLANIKVDKTTKIDSDPFLEGFRDNNYTEYILDSAGKEIDYKGGWTLEAGKTYIYCIGFNDVTPEIKANDTYYYSASFSEVK